MLLESVSSTGKRAEELLNSINENKITLETPFHLKDHFSGLYIYILFKECNKKYIIFHWPELLFLFLTLLLTLQL